MSRTHGLYALRAGLSTTVRFEHRGHRTYVLKDPSTGKELEFGEEEHFICSLLTGRYTLPIVQTAFRKRFNMNISIEQLEALIRRLNDAGLLAETRGASITDLLETSLPDTWTRFRMFDPDRFFSFLAAKLGFCFTVPFVVVSAVFVLLAAFIAYHNVPRIESELKELFDNIPLHQIFIAGYLFINIPGEIARGVACSRYGGRVDEFGLWFAYELIPKFYCRGRVWEINSKKGRGWTFISACYYSFLASAVSVFMWAVTDSGTALHTFWLIAAMAGLIDGLVRANFLWPTDAQFAFDNWMEIPAFRNRAISAVIAWLWGRPMPERFSRHDRTLFLAYGAAALSTTLAGVAVLSYFLSAELIRTLGGGGALIIFFAVFFKYRKWFGERLKQQKAVQWIMKNDNNSGKTGFLRKYRKWLLLTAIALLMFIPYPYEPGGPFKFLSVKQVEVHTQVSGEIKEVFVKEGDWIERGAIIAVLDPREHQRNYDATRANLEKSQAELKLLKAGAKEEEVEKARQQLDTARTNHEYSEREARRLEALYKGGAVSQEEHDAAAKMASVDSQNVKVAQANLQLVMSGARPEEVQAQEALVRDLDARLKYYGENLARCVVMAPITGQVMTQNLDKSVGRILAENEHLLTIQDSTVIQAEVYMPEAEMDEDRVGALVKVRPWAYPTSIFYGRVISVAPKAEDSAGGKVVRVITEIPNKDLMLKPDMTGEAKIEGGWKPLIVAFTRSIVRFVMVEVWSWLP